VPFTVVENSTPSCGYERASPIGLPWCSHRRIDGSDHCGANPSFKIAAYIERIVGHDPVQWSLCTISFPSDDDQLREGHYISFAEEFRAERKCQVSPR